MCSRHVPNGLVLRQACARILVGLFLMAGRPRALCDDVEGDGFAPGIRDLTVHRKRALTVRDALLGAALPEADLGQEDSGVGVQSRRRRLAQEDNRFLGVPDRQVEVVGGDLESCEVHERLPDVGRWSLLTPDLQRRLEVATSGGVILEGAVRQSKVVVDSTADPARKCIVADQERSSVLESTDGVALATLRAEHSRLRRKGIRRQIREEIAVRGEVVDGALSLGVGAVQIVCVPQRSRIGQVLDGSAEDRRLTKRGPAGIGLT